MLPDMPPVAVVVNRTRIRDLGRFRRQFGQAAGQARPGGTGRGWAGVPGTMRSMDPPEPEHLVDSGMAETVRLRRAGRVILLDPGERVLLLRYDNGPPDGRHWATPGGGLNPGESYAAAAIRELAEETGWDDVALLGEVRRHVRTMEHGGQIVRQHERLFLARTDRAQRELGDVTTMHAADGIAAWRWWTLAELDTTAEVIWPAGLAELIRGALGRR
jgi:ADP-ribose pyrophosphatase YjhB (NUDIX family)